ncbi:MAG: arginine--tRNA ligase [Candidatus Pacebacteria bacterium]|jgi:arginyl-tRNA synthetase|nr:arginine--tRNA ligase [Candidatus Paceibacterota bacterium]
MIREQINSVLGKALKNLAKEGFFGGADIGKVMGQGTVSVCKDSVHGDYSSNIAMRLAGAAKKSPVEIAQKIKETLDNLPEAKKIFANTEAVVPGFVNFFLAPGYVWSQTAAILKAGKKFGHTNTGKNKKANVEFVSANPSGQLHVGNGRSAFYGDALANILAAAGYKVEKEYYINDARVSKQIQTLGATALGRGEAYLSPYLKEKIAALQPKLSKIHSETDAGYFLAGQVLKDLKKFVAKDLKIGFDNWMSEEDLYKKRLVMKTYDLLKKKGLVFEKDDAWWLDMSKYNQKDEVLLRSNASPTYFLSDIAYHLDKMKRGYKLIIDIWGADHQGHVPRMKAVMDILGYKGDFDVLICQIVTIKGGKISKREGNIVSLNWLIDEVGVDAARFFYLQNSLSSQMEFDVALAKQKSSDSPVFYVQYAHARIASILRKAKAKKPVAGIPLAVLEHPSEIGLAKELLRLPEAVNDTAADYQTQRICLYATNLATAFHKFYRDCQVITENKELTRARLSLIFAAKIALENTLALLGISAPEKM